MRAALLTGNGGPETLVVRDDVDPPTPAVDEVLIRVAACGMNNTDINTRVGWYSRSVTSGTTGGGFDEASTDDATWGRGGLAFPRIQGADVVGRIIAVGAAADDGLIGRRVLVDPWIRDADDPMRRELAGYLGSERDGGFAELCAVPARNVHPIDSALTDAELATFACSWSTAEHMLHRVRLDAGQSIAVTGASGGVGSALVQLAKRRGATVTAVAGASKHEAVRALGADHLVDRAADDAPAAAVARAGEPFDVVADIVGGDAFGGWLDALHRGGRYVTSGAIAGPVVDLDLRTLYLNDLELYGATVYEPQVFADLVGYVERGEVRPVLAGTYPLEQIHEAQAAFERKQHVGNLVITI
ncbi:MAG: alcohol dehydrogenase family protein [Ilumatobacter sp.]|uniref:alcohol dehydrogenase family protein n=1 Tax=Ilumatobacter sp. TaxID=1967498 RepID=UPI00262BA20E|nr:alcohol dehydrogenase family protein [Ilumatobacter sp.]MDJ0771741.1 alcohol dehydrogenase family protein [Ilumatobacter sp.]